MFEIAKYVKNRARRLKGLYEDKKNIESIMQQLQDEAPSLLKQIDIANSVPENIMSPLGAASRTAMRDGLWMYQKKYNGGKKMNFSELPVYMDFSSNYPLIIFPLEKQSDFSSLDFIGQDIALDIKEGTSLSKLCNNVKIVGCSDNLDVFDDTKDDIKETLDKLNEEYPEVEYVVGVPHKQDFNKYDDMFIWYKGEPTKIKPLEGLEKYDDMYQWYTGEPKKVEPAEGLEKYNDMEDPSKEETGKESESNFSGEDSFEGII